MESTISVNAAPTDMTTPERPTRPVEPHAPARNVRWVDNPIIIRWTNSEISSSINIGNDETTNVTGDQDVTTSEVITNTNENTEATEENHANNHDEHDDDNDHDDHYHDYSDEPLDDDDDYYATNLCPGCDGYFGCNCHDDYADANLDFDDEWVHCCGDRDCSGDCGQLECGCIDVCRGRCGRDDYW